MDIRTQCKNCGVDFDRLNYQGPKPQFCSRKCGANFHNSRKDRMEPNVHFNCEICGKEVHKYLTPSRQKEWPGRFCSRTCAGIWRQKEDHPRWRGGRHQDKDGYWYVLRPDHPQSNAKGAIFEHRLVMEEHLGRFLTAEEVVHHENDDPSDNRLENLRLFPNQAEHKRYHEQFRERNSDGTFTQRG